MKRILMIAYHFPPLAGSSGIQRTLRFVQHLPEFGWQPLVLTAHPRAYEKTSPDLLADVPADTVVHRAFALDTGRHLSIAGRYPGFLARPDRWLSWKFDGIRQGLAMIAKYQPDIVWSTYPIATAHLIGSELSGRSGLPWVADFRDPMAQDDYPTDRKTWNHFKHIEEQAMRQASLALFTTPGAARLYRGRYPNAKARVELLENGYDEETFVAAEASLDSRAPLNPGYFTLLHSGIVYPSERDPTVLLAALGELNRNGQIADIKLKIRFRAPEHYELLRRLGEENNVTDIVEVLPPIPYREALAEMLRTDGLLVLQAANCNNQIPAKIYEYLRARKPICALTDPTGDTAETLKAAGLRTIAPIDNKEAIIQVLRAIASSSSPSQPTDEAIQDSSRRGRSRMLAGLLDGLASRQRR